MNPAGVIITYIDWSDWKQWYFNIPLFLFQLTFMVVGTAIGKIKWDRHRNIIATVILWPIAISMWFVPNVWLNAILLAIILFIGIPTLRNIPWAVVWRAAQASHVRLCLKKMLPDYAEKHISGEKWRYINFGYPKAEIQPWRLDQCDGKRFEYRDPTFTFSQERIDSMIQYAEDQVGKKYDWLQLLSPPVNFPLWVLYPPKWGKEIIRWFNLPGGREFCSSGAVVTVLWFAEATQVRDDMKILDGDESEFFGNYDPAVIPPCLFVISEKWKPESNMVIQKRYFDRLVEETTGVPDILRGKDDDQTNH